MYSPSDSCYMCQYDLINYLTLKRISPVIVGELSKERWDDNYPPEKEQRQEALNPQTYNQITLKKIVGEQDQQSCFHCGRKSHLEWREHLEAVPSFHFDRVNETEPEGIKVEELSVGKL